MNKKTLATARDKVSPNGLLLLHPILRATRQAGGDGLVWDVGISINSWARPSAEKDRLLVPMLYGLR